MIMDLLSVVLLVAALGFFFAGTVGLLRFPDLYTRVHALTKADNVGLGLMVAGLALQAEHWREVILLLIIWCLVLVAGATVSFLVGNEAYRRGRQPWRGRLP